MFLQERRAIEVSNVHKRYGSTTALDGVSLTIERGELHILAGPNGSGKSTLLSIIAGAERPDKGRVSVLGLNPWRDHEEVSSRISALLDRTSIHPWATGIEVARLVSNVRGVEWGQVVDIAERLNVKGFWRRPYMTYSSGMKKRLLLLLALAGAPDVVILDEPFQGLDRETSKRLIGMIREMASRESTIIVATHIMPRELMSISTGVTMMELGRVVYSGRGKDAMSIAKALGVECI